MNVLSILTFVILAVTSFGYAMGQYRKGREEGSAASVKNSTEVIVLQNKQIDSLQAIVKDYDGKFSKLGEQLKVMEAIIQEKDSKLKDYMVIMQGRNPDSENFMRLLTETAKDSQKYMKETIEMIKDMSKEIDDMHKKLDSHLAWRQPQNPPVVNN